MKKYVLIIVSFFTFTYAQNPYCAGETVSITHQNESQSVCAAYDGYEVDDIFKLADYNGDLNGGNYHVIFIDMGATW